MKQVAHVGILPLAPEARPRFKAVDNGCMDGCNSVDGASRKDDATVCEVF